MATLQEIARRRPDGRPALVIEIDPLGRRVDQALTHISAVGRWFPDAILIEDRGVNGDTSVRLALGIRERFDLPVVVCFDPGARSTEMIILDQLTSLHKAGVRELVLPDLMHNLYAQNGVSFKSILSILARNRVSFVMSVSCDPWVKGAYQNAVEFSQSSPTGLLYTPPVFEAEALDELCTRWRNNNLAVDFAARLIVPNNGSLYQAARRFTVTVPAVFHTLSPQEALSKLAEQARRIIKQRSVRAMAVVTQNDTSAARDFLRQVYG